MAWIGENRGRWKLTTALGAMTGLHGKAAGKHDSELDVRAGLVCARGKDGRTRVRFCGTTPAWINGQQRLEGGAAWMRWTI
ncbi:hypothetical protein M0R45_009254 [Rubus argutus]|uniref:Uncharacterized protein n=1 Tax=Rubus argutus TaxID=59490 RepID=A0AAW1Y4E8_RUBAR